MSLEKRLSAYYGLFFLSIGSVMPFAALWFDTLNLSPTVSGSIFAAPSVAIVLFSVIIGRWADRLSDWRSAIIVCNWIVLGVFSWFLFRVNSWDVLIIWTLAGFFTHASGPIMDAAALNLTEKRGGDYGRIRAFGSIGFIVGVLVAGAFYQHVGVQWFVAVLLLTTVGRIIAAHGLPYFRELNLQTAAPSSTSTVKNATPESPVSNVVKRQGIGFLRHPGIVLVILGASLINASPGFYNVFAVLHWTTLGISTTMASVLWAVAVFVEVALMWSFRSVAQRFSARKCLLFASAVCVARWLLSGLNLGLAQLFILQSLHSITFGLSFLASVSFIARRVSEENAAQAQSVASVTVTLFMAVAMWLSGWLYEQVGGLSYWAMAVMAGLGGLCIALSFTSNLQDPTTVKYVN